MMMAQRVTERPVTRATETAAARQRPFISLNPRRSKLASASTSGGAEGHRLRGPDRDHDACRTSSIVIDDLRPKMEYPDRRLTGDRRGRRGTVD